MSLMKDFLAILGGIVLLFFGGMGLISALLAVWERFEDWREERRAVRKKKQNVVPFKPKVVNDKLTWE